MNAIMFATDENYAPHLGVLLKEITSQSSCFFKFYIMADSLCAGTVTNLKDCAKGNNVVFLDVSEISEFLPNVDGYISRTTYARLFLDQFDITEQYILYLDCDIVVTNDICLIFETRLDDYVIGAVVSADGVNERIHELGIDPESSYFNAGVLYIDVDKWKDLNVGQNAIALLTKRGKKMLWKDQDALNLVLERRWKPLPLEWNCHSHHYRSVLHPLLCHFTGPLKPWHYMCNNSYVDIYKKYKKDTPFAAMLYPDFTIMNIIKKNIVQPLRRILKCNHTLY